MWASSVDSEKAEWSSTPTWLCHIAKNFLPMARGFLYLVAIMDWHSRYVVAWRLSNTLDAGFCAGALEEALGEGQPKVFNTDRGSQFTSWSSPRSWWTAV